MFSLHTSLSFVTANVLLKYLTLLTTLNLNAFSLESQQSYDDLLTSLVKNENSLLSGIKRNTTNLDNFLKKLSYEACNVSHNFTEDEESLPNKSQDIERNAKFHHLLRALRVNSKYYSQLQDLVRPKNSKHQIVLAAYLHQLQSRGYAINEKQLKELEFKSNSLFQTEHNLRRHELKSNYLSIKTQEKFLDGIKVNERTKRVKKTFMSMRFVCGSIANCEHFITEARTEVVRRKLYKKLHFKSDYNLIITVLIQLAGTATLLGYNHHYDLVQSNMQLTDTEGITNFLNKVSKSLRSPMKKQISLLKEFKKEFNFYKNNDPAVHLYDISFLIAEKKRWILTKSPQKWSKYFGIFYVTTKLFRIFQKIFDVDMTCHRPNIVNMKCTMNRKGKTENIGVINLHFGDNLNMQNNFKAFKVLVPNCHTDKLTKSIPEVVLNFLKIPILDEDVYVEYTEVVEIARLVARCFYVILKNREFAFLESREDSLEMFLALVEFWAWHPKVIRELSWPSDKIPERYASFTNCKEFESIRKESVVFDAELHEKLKLSDKSISNMLRARNFSMVLDVVNITLIAKLDLIIHTSRNTSWFENIGNLIRNIHREQLMMTVPDDLDPIRSSFYSHSNAGKHYLRLWSKAHIYPVYKKLFDGEDVFNKAIWSRIKSEMMSSFDLDGWEKLKKISGEYPVADPYINMVTESIEDFARNPNYKF